jgi:hypothetical protein
MSGTSNRSSAANPAKAVEADASPPMASDPRLLNPSDTEVEAWAERERQRRKAWLEGPTAEEREAYAKRHRERRLMSLGGDSDDRLGGGARIRVPSPRDAQLIAEGAMSVMWKWSRRQLESLERAGRDWEEEVTSQRRRKRVPLDDEAD